MPASAKPRWLSLSKPNLPKPVNVTLHDLPHRDILAKSSYLEELAVDQQRIGVWIGAVIIGAGCGYIVENTLNLYGGYIEWITFFVITSVFVSIPLKTVHRLIIGMIAGGISMLSLFLIGFYGGQMGNGYEKFLVPGMVIWSLCGTIFGLASGLIAAGLWRVVRPVQRLISSH